MQQLNQAAEIRRKAVVAYCEARDRGDEDLARELEGPALMANEGMAKAVSVRMCGTRDEDFEQAAMLGMLESLRSYDPDQAKLSTHAWPRMQRRVAELAESTVLPVRVPTGTYRAVRRVKLEAGRTGMGLDEAAKALGVPIRTVKRGLVVGCSLEQVFAGVYAPEDFEEKLMHEEQVVLAEGVMPCWRRGTIEEVESAARGLADRAEQLKRSDEELARALWPDQAEARLEVLARLDAALWLLEREHGLDATLWRAHVVEGLQWRELAEEHGVTRQRVAFRARRRERRLAELLEGLAGVSRRGLELWAERPVMVEVLERMGLLAVEAEPVEVEYAVEDLEVALSEIDEIDAGVWQARNIAGMTRAELAEKLGASELWIEGATLRASWGLLRLLAHEVEEWSP